MTFAPSPAQQRFFDWVSTGSGNCILEAVAGAGKTTTILNGIAAMHGRVWLGVYNKKMAVEVKEKIAGRADLRDRHGLYASTFHSAGYSALRFAFGRRGAALDIDDKKVIKISRHVVQSNLTEFKALEGSEATIAKIVSMAKNRGIGAIVTATFPEWLAMVSHFDLDGNLPETVSTELAVQAAMQVLTISNDDLNTIDFDDMVYLPLQRKLRMLKHEWVLVDEAQDTNPTRRALAASLLAPGGRLVAVGDPYQAIFGFTGADNDALDQIAEQFNAQRLPLNASFRCPRAVVEHAQQWVPHIESVDTAAAGSVSEMSYDDFVTDTDFDAMNLRETAILCRYNKYLVSLCFKLIRRGIPAKIEGRSIGDNLIALSQRWKVTNIPALENRLEAYLAREVAKAIAAEQDDKADRITDQVETLLVIMRRVMADGSTKVADVRTEIMRMFDDNISNSGVVTLCSAHKSKGLEWDTVFLLGRGEFMPSKMARQPWQLDQERNLIYVAVTRAKNALVEVVGIAEPDEEKGA